MVTVITVCYQAEKTIEMTLRSILQQTYQQIEYVIKDGGSTDRTNEIIDGYKPLFEERGIPVIHISKKDAGIYDAMNQAVEYASGDWVSFMNAGDTYYRESTLEKVFSQQYDLVDVIYGDTLEDDHGYQTIRMADMGRVLKRMPFGHQACFIRTACMKEYAYDTDFRISADYHAVLRMYRAGKSFAYCGEIVSIFAMDGISSTDFTVLVKERERARLACGVGDGYRSLDYRVKYIEAWVKTTLQKHCPAGLLKGLRRFYLRYIKKNKPVESE